MKKIFDDNIANQLNQLEVDLPQNDWDVLLAKIPTKKRRAIPIWYYISAASVVLLLGFGSLFMLYNDSTKGNNQEFTAKVVSDSKTDTYSEKNEQASANYNNSPIAVNEIYERNSKVYDTPRASETNSRAISSGKKRNTNSFLDGTQSNSNISIDIQELPSEANIQDTNTDSRKADSTPKKHKTIQQHDADKSLDEYRQEYHQQPTPKDNIRKQRQQLKDRNSLTRDYYADIHTSVSPLSGNGSVSKGVTDLMSTGGLMSMLSPYDVQTRHNIPVSIGMSIGIPLIQNQLYFNTGLRYTYLYSVSTTIDRETSKAISADEQNLHYIGIPLGLSYQFVEKGIFRAYLSASATLEKGISKVTRHINYMTSSYESNFTERIDGFATSFAVGGGVGVKIVRSLEFYLEPEFSWFIFSKKYPQPESRITQNPINIGVTGGLRWNF
jgi:hypothetical protein